MNENIKMNENEKAGSPFFRGLIYALPFALVMWALIIVVAL